jgi:hypothetical protein
MLNRFFACFFLVAFIMPLKAQDKKSVRLNLLVDYAAGLQFMPLSGFELQNRLFVRDKNPAGSFYNDHGFKPTIMQKVSIATTPFKSKKWYLEFNFFWGKNQAECYGYVIDNPNVIKKVTSIEKISFSGIGIGIKREIKLNSWSKIMPKLYFVPLFGGTYENKTTYVALNKTTGEQIGADFIDGTAGIITSPANYHMLFFDPTLGVDYSIKLRKGFSFNICYSFWFKGTLPGLYRKSLSKDRNFGGNNISLGVSYKLFK